MPRRGFSMAQIMPDSAAAVTCRLVALLYGASLRASPMRQLRSVPIRILLMSCEQHAEFVDPVRDLLHHDSFAILQVPVAAGEFVDGQDRIVARMIGVMTGRTIDRPGSPSMTV